MKLYTITDADGAILAWAGSQEDARKAKKARPGATKWEETNVATDKVGLLDFLNTNVVSTITAD